MPSRRCPDCDVAMQESDYDVNANRDKVRLKPDGFLGELGLRGSTYLVTYVCPECGLVRFYAE
ncbi:hypothetical protein ELS19_11605 [Halogeometricum borinquense]|uniref:Nucleic acid-binding protein n=3 Tax=Halogeometricum borinquense TaxID=60847 RepID=E4NQK1_HALBP|nr:hypothetical protein [Halogeometricum borinquense]ADQ66689.1 hypothetical protein Hbor_10990 [Halogeometricum borinquense DSM 11551]RYJ14533.1 hypothetical protein ELS19_11605 [Halogeometricum borinquense]